MDSTSVSILACARLSSVCVRISLLFLLIFFIYLFLQTARPQVARVAKRQAGVGRPLLARRGGPRETVSQRLFLEVRNSARIPSAQCSLLL